MSTSSAAACEEASSDYAAYVMVDMHAELKGIYEAVEEMQLRLEEFTSIVGMLQAKGDKSITENVPRLLALKPHVDMLCKRVEALESFIKRVNTDLTVLEANVEAAESALSSSDSKFTKLNPFTFFKKPSEPSASAPQQTVPQILEVFKTDDYFKNESS